MLTISVDSLWNFFNNRLIGLMNARMPTKTIKGRKMTKPWIDRKVRTAIRKKASLYIRIGMTKRQKVDSTELTLKQTGKTSLLFIHKHH